MFCVFCSMFFSAGMIYMSMGRKPLNKSYEEILQEARERAKDYYEKNKDAVKRKRMDRYNQLKQDGRSLLTESDNPTKKVL